ncbi:39S ribosomal protein L35, mitochondrial [Halotydeus destructor]|nr:39S ribosomal protein L35, mitochondrial [Halotydeus destructor]
MALRLFGSALGKLGQMHIVKPAAPVMVEQLRTKMLDPPQCVIYYDHDTGKRHTLPETEKRFFRLRWGGWIRCKAGRHKRLWKKSADERWYARQHMFLTTAESAMLEKMVTPEYKKTRHFLDDPYEPYHKRHNFDLVPRGQDKVSKSYIQLMYEY